MHKPRCFYRAKAVYSISGAFVTGKRRFRCGKHNWFGDSNFGNGHLRGWANFLETTSFRHAAAQYRRLKVNGRQIDMRSNRKKRVLFADTDRI